MAPSVFAVPVVHADVEAHPRRVALTHDGTARNLTPRAQLRRDFMEARAAKARYDLPKVLSLATDCRDLAFKLHKLKPARVCDEAMFGVARRLGDARTMVGADYWWQQHGFAAADKTSKVYSAFQKANLARLVNTVPAFSAAVAGSPSVLKYPHRIEFSGRLAAEPLTSRRPTVMATIDGKPVAVMVDTGTVLPLMMDQAHATALGATPLLGELVAPGMEKHPLPGAKGFSTDLIANFKFGDLVMHNVATAVVPDGRFHVGVLVGLPVLARFGRVDLDDARIATGMAVPHCTSSMPLRFVGVGQLGFSTTANGRPAIAMVDTGSMYALFAKPEARPNSSAVSKTSLWEWPEAPSAHHRQVGVQIGEWSMTGIDMPDAKLTLPPNVDVSIGAPLLTFADVRIDFAKPSLCVSPKPPVKDGAVFVHRDRREESFAKSPIGILLGVLEHAVETLSSRTSIHDNHAASHAQ
ncbi:MAG TPA: retropepsin-like aspartic protease [Rhodanobacteraceae bacterium]|nr:retropepsin-like aspartic protease [Rhodanobacteraceae bacterium]